MNKSQAQKRIEKLKKVINHHRYLYHIKDKQEISDAALDSLKHELNIIEERYPDLITPDSPTQRVGGRPLEKFKKVEHKIRMLSFEDVFSAEELREWEIRIRKMAGNSDFDYFAELKIDGFAVSLEYEGGVLKRGSTRGDGRVGEDVTQNLKTIESIPLKLTEDIDIEVRGEVFLNKKEFDRINREQEKKGEKIYANPRNLAAGSIRQLDSKIAAARKLDFFAYGVITDKSLKMHREEHELAEKLGFKINHYNKHCENLDQVIEFYEYWKGEKREKLPYLIDGVVVMVNQKYLHKKLGVVGKAPRYAIAFKFPAEQTTTVVEEIKIQVGRTGALTPVAYLKPVEVAGTTVSRATLHNEDEIKRLGVRVGDTVIIQKAGDVIPDVVEVVKGLRTGKEKKFHMPDNCPICGAKVFRRLSEATYYCSNKSCYAKEREQLIHFVSKKGFNIEGMGPKIIEQLIEEGLVGDSADVFELNQGDLEPLERFAEKSAQNLLDSIEASKQIDLSNFLYALGIRFVGEESSALLAQFLKVDSIKELLNKLQNLSVEDWQRIEGIGEKAAQSLDEYFADKNNINLLKRLSESGVRLKSPKINQKSGVTDKSFVLTGSLENLSRDEAKDMIRMSGGHVSSSISSKTNYLVLGKNPGSKLEKAKKFNVNIISEKEFIGLLK